MPAPMSPTRNGCCGICGTLSNDGVRAIPLMY
jgi:hypothetical protein